MPNNRNFDVAGIGSPLLDMLVHVSETELSQLELSKGEMHLIDESKSKEILSTLSEHPIKISPGGSTANTLDGVSLLGGRTVFMGTIGNDENGTLYLHKTIDNGVIPRLSTYQDAATGHAITFITPDGERTFATHLGAASFFREENISEDDIRESAILHIEAYQLEDPQQRKAIIRAFSIAKESDTRISIDLSDPALVARIDSTLHSIVSDYADIVFANEHEAQAFTGKDGEESLNTLSELCDIAVVKRGEHGSLIKAGGVVYHILRHATTVANTNGAGDMYAAGILYGLTHGLSYPESGDLASFAAACVVASEGARLETDLKQKVKNYSIELINA